MDWTEVEGETYEDAVSTLLNALGADMSEVEVENLGDVRKLFGFGKKVVRVRGRLKKDAFDDHDHREEIRSFIEEMSAKGGKAVVADTRRKDERPQRQAEPRRRQEPPAAAPRPLPEGEPSEVAKKACAQLGAIISSMGVEGASVIAYEKEGEITLDVRSDVGGFIIGRKGETLEALQTVMEIYVTRLTDDRVQVVVDTENYRQRREGKLMDLARKAARRVAKSGRRVPLGPMKSSERKIIHTVLQDSADVTTRSEGEGERRQVIVVPKK